MAQTSARSLAPFRPGDLVRHPAAMISLAVLLLNDHVLKAAYPGVITGKLSDVAGLAFFPFLVVAIWELAALARGHQNDRVRIAAIAGLATAIGFVAVKLVPQVASSLGVVVGGAQWLVLGGPLTGMAPWWTTFAPDPSDLLALPAAASAWLIARRRQNEEQSTARQPGSAGTSRTPGRAALALLLVGSLATLATSYGPATVSSEIVLPFEDDETPGPEIRYVHFVVDTDDPRVGRIALTASAWREISSNETEPVPVLDAGISLVAEGMSLTSVENWWTGSTLDLTETCRNGCDGGAWIVVDRVTAAGGQAFDLAVGVVVESEASGPDVTVEAHTTLEEVADRAPAAVPSRVASRASGSVVLTGEEPTGSTRVRLTIREEALGESTSFPLVGRLRADLQVGRPYGTSGILSVAGEPEPRYQQESSIDVDWLALCAADRDCTIDLEIEQSLVLEVWDEQPPDTEVPWTLDASLIAFDGREIPTDAITLEVID